MNAGIDAKVLASILSSLGVGPHKAAGYLPLYNIRDFLKRDPQDLVVELHMRELSARIFHADECPIKSGALYAWDEAAAKRIVKKHWADDIEVEEIVSRTATTWFEPHHVLMPLIHELFGDDSKDDRSRKNSQLATRDPDRE